jgi:hypothetical protein
MGVGMVQYYLRKNTLVDFRRNWLDIRQLPAAASARTAAPDGRSTHTPEQAFAKHTIRLGLVSPGDCVNVIAVSPDGDGGESFWLLVTGIRPGGFEGTVNNHLINSAYHGLRLGDRMTVGHEQVHGVLSRQKVRER